MRLATMVQTETADEQAEKIPSQFEAETHRILVVDDDPSVLDFLSRLLSNHGFVVDRGTGRRDAETLLANESYSIVLSDLSLPDGSGIEVVTRARTLDPAAVCILITGHGTMESAIDAIHAEVYDFIPKPFEINQLLAAVRRGVEKRRLEKENHRLLEELRRERERLKTRVDEATRDLQIKLREVEDLNNEITVLFEIVRDIRGDLRMSESLERFLEYLGRAIRYDAGFWMVADPCDRIQSSKDWEGPPERRFALADLSPTQIEEFRKILSSNENRSFHPEATRVWLAEALGLGVTPDRILLAPFKTSTEIQGFVGLVRSDPFTPRHSRLLPLAVSLLTTLWEENAVIQRGSQMASIGEITAELAHDLRNGLSAFRHIADHLVDQVDLEDPKNLEYREVLYENLDRTDALIAELLTFGGPEEDFGQTTPVRDLLDRVLKISGKSLERKGVRVVLDVEDDRLVALGSIRELSEALLNVVVNSIQAMEEGGELRVAADSVERPRQPEAPESLGRFVRISVADTGVGIPPENLKRIFGRYFTTKSEGTGLGLSRLQKVARKCLGAVEIESEVGKGTTVTLFLPEV